MSVSGISSGSNREKRRLLPHRDGLREHLGRPDRGTTWIKRGIVSVNALQNSIKDHHLLSFTGIPFAITGAFTDVPRNRIVLSLSCLC